MQRQIYGLITKQTAKELKRKGWNKSMKISALVDPRPYIQSRITRLQNVKAKSKDQRYKDKISGALQVYQGLLREFNRLLKPLA